MTIIGSTNPHTPAPYLRLLLLAFLLPPLLLMLLLVLKALVLDLASFTATTATAMVTVRSNERAAVP